MNQAEVGGHATHDVDVMNQAEVGGHATHDVDEGGE